MNQTRNTYNPIKAGLWYTISNILIKAIPFLSLPIFTRLLTTEDFGIYNVYLSYETILSVIIGMGLSGTIRAASVNFTEKFEDYITALLLLHGLMAVVVLPAATVFVYLVGESGLPLFVCVLLAAHSFFSAIYGILSNTYAISGEIKKNIALSFFVTVLNVGLSLLFIFTLYAHEHYMGRITGTAVSYVAVVSVFAISYIKSVRISNIKRFWKYSLRLGIPVLPHLLAMVIFSQCDKIMIQKLIGNSEAGIYSLGVTIASVLTVIVSSIDNAWAPWFYGNLKESRYVQALRGNNILSQFFFALTVAFILVLPDVVHVFAQKDYWASIPSAVILTVSVFIGFMYLFSVNTEYFFQKTTYISVFTVISVAVNIVLNWLFIRWWGYVGAALATCLSRFLLYVLHCFQAGTLLREKIVSHGVLLLELFAIVFIACLVCKFQQYFIVRWVGLLPTGICLLYLQKKRKNGR